LDKFSGAHNSVNMLFLDACRNVATGAKGGTKGLAQPTDTPNGSLVVYATKAGQVANDNSYFINALIRNLKNFNQTVRDLGDNISLSVAQKSSQEQIPVVYSSLLPKLLLKSKKINITETAEEDDSKISKKSYVTKVDCSIYGDDATMCTTCAYDYVYLGKGKAPNDSWNNPTEYDDIYYKDENKIIFNYKILSNGTTWATSNNLFRYTDNFIWNKGRSGRYYHSFKANTQLVKYIKTRDRGAIMLTGISEETDREKVSYRLTLTKKYHKFYKNHETKLSEKITTSSCLFYKPAWCGDGVRDEKYEECDFKDKSKKGFGYIGCTPTCKSM